MFLRTGQLPVTAEPGEAFPRAKQPRQGNPISPKLPPRTRTEVFLSHVATLLIIAALFAFTYVFFDVVLLIFSAILISILLTLLADPITRYLKVHRWAALIIAGIALVGIVGGTGYLFGSRIVTDFQEVASRMATAQTSIRATLEGSELGKLLLAHVAAPDIPITQIATSIFSISAGVLAGIAVAVIAGVYLAAQPSLYLNELLTMFPPQNRTEAEETAEAVANGLYRWLEGQFISMVLIGLLSAFATWVIGLPSFFALGLIAGITEFVPYVGPIIAAIPALLVAATQSLDAVFWTLGAYIAIHLIEGNVIAPLVQRQMVYIPPAIMLLGIATLSLIFGTAAIIFAGPLVVVVYVLIKKLYVRDSLGEETIVPGETPDK